MRHRRSTIPKSGLEISITILIKKHKALPAVLKKVENLYCSTKRSPKVFKKSQVQSKIEERCAIDDFKEFGRTDDVEASKETDAEVEVL